jgi:hypothetical protein
MFLRDALINTSGVRRRKKRTKPRQHSKAGTASIIFGTLGLLMIVIPGLINSAVLLPGISVLSVDLLFIFSSLCLGVVAIVIGGKAKKQGDTYGTYGMPLGKLTIILGSVEIAFILVFFSGVFFL